MNDPEREDLLHRLDESERARRKWKVLALVGTPILAVLLMIVLGNAVSSWFALREMAEQIREERKRALEAAELAIREADEAHATTEQSLVAAKEALMRAEQVLKEKPGVEKDP